MKNEKEPFEKFMFLKRVFHLVVFALSLSSPLHAQQSEEASGVLLYIQKAMNFSRVTPQEKVYLHFDNTGYFENETMWFKAYVTGHQD